MKVDKYIETEGNIYRDRIETVKNLFNVKSLNANSSMIFFKLKIQSCVELIDHFTLVVSWLVDHDSFRVIQT